MTNTNESPISVTFKAGTAQYAPQITVRGDTGAEFLSRLLELNPEVSEGLENDDPITNAIAVFQASWIETWALAAKALEGTVAPSNGGGGRSEEHTSELQSRENLVCRLLLEKKKTQLD